METVLPEVQPTPYKQIFKSFNVNITQVAKHMGLSYAYAASMLNGIVRMTPANKEKLDSLVKSLGGGVDG